MTVTVSTKPKTDLCGGGGAEGGAGVKRKGRAAMDEAMHVVKESMTDIGGLGYFHVSPSPPSKLFPATSQVDVVSGMLKWNRLSCRAALPQWTLPRNARK